MAKKKEQEKSYGSRLRSPMVQTHVFTVPPFQPRKCYVPLSCQGPSHNEKKEKAPHQLSRYSLRARTRFKDAALSLCLRRDCERTQLFHVREYSMFRVIPHARGVQQQILENFLSSQHERAQISHAPKCHFEGIISSRSKPHPLCGIIK